MKRGFGVVVRDCEDRIINGGRGTEPASSVLMMEASNCLEEGY
ncbi:hypothetical protein SLEP1_g32460 [Rubroshorea leprosula]|uniref:RNase H type-1 domain-containing protein n=1 Tax=Rubroshorea leprosula TaxID=152421 RepID=A0AAV5KDC8_9ROSI|nr:hypothetical protein SLEP1_g32460 [Rubroshorea leprosula]